MSDKRRQIIGRVREDVDVKVDDEIYVFRIGPLNNAGANLLVDIVAEVLHVFIEQVEITNKLPKYPPRASGMTDEERVKAYPEIAKQQEELLRESGDKLGEMIIEKIDEIFPKLPNLVYDIVIACCDIEDAALDDKDAFVRSLDVAPMTGIALSVILDQTDTKTLLDVFVKNFQKLLGVEKKQQESGETQLPLTSEKI